MTPFARNVSEEEGKKLLGNKWNFFVSRKKPESEAFQTCLYGIQKSQNSELTWGTRNFVVRDESDHSKAM